MAHREDASRVPVLVAPREQSIVNAHRVTFIWKPVKTAQSYRVQIAREASFSEIVYESKPLNRTEFTLRDELPADENTYFWRVLTQDEDGMTHGEDNIESFVSGTEADVAAHIEQPDQDEDLGPLERLVRAASAEAAVEVTGAPKWVREEDELGVEHEGIEAGQILGMVLAIVVSIALAVFVLFQYVDLTAQTVQAEATGRSGYPELRESRLHATQLLTQYDVIDSEPGRYRIPIDRAMDLMLQEAASQPSADLADELSMLQPAAE